MSIRQQLENEILAAGERVLGKMDSFPPVAFYLCKKGYGDLCTPWVLATCDRGQTPGSFLATEIVEVLNKKTDRGPAPCHVFTASEGYINICFNDEFIMGEINRLSKIFTPELYRSVRPDDSTKSFLQEYCIYRACNREPFNRTEKPFTGFLREVAVLVIFSQITGHTEKLKEAVYMMCRQGTEDDNLLRAAAGIFVKNLK